MSDQSKKELPLTNQKTLGQTNGLIKPAMLNYQTPNNTPALGGYTLTQREKILAIIALGVLILPALKMEFTPDPMLIRVEKIKAIADIDGMKSALDMFKAYNNRYPSTHEGLLALLVNPGNLEHWKKTLDTSMIPSDPWGHPYIYRSPGKNGNPFDLLSVGPDGKEGTSDDISH